jgi:hypothetical protein
MAERTLVHYLAATRSPPLGCPPLSPARVRDALGYAPWWPPEPAPLTPINAVAAVRRPLLDALALRLRGTVLGQVLVQLLPQGVVARLRARLS